jgi:hypothetical protein
MTKTDKATALELLMGIKGVGEATAEKLLVEFKTVDKISKANKAALLEAGLNSRTASAVLGWAATQDKQRQKVKRSVLVPEVVPVSIPTVATSTPPAVPTPALVPVSTPVPVPRIPIPLPFGNRGDVRIRITAQPEIIATPVPSGVPVKATPLPASAVITPKKRAKPVAKPAVATKPIPRKAQPLPDVVNSSRGVAFPLADSGEIVFVDRRDMIQSDRGPLARVYNAADKPLGYGIIVYGQVKLVQLGH